MSAFSNAFSYLQKIGKCMMLPVSVLPVAGILLGVGSANFSWLPHGSLADHGAIRRRDFFQPAAALCHRRGHRPDQQRRRGSAGEHGGICGVPGRRWAFCAKLRGIETATAMGIPTIETGVFGGIIVGLIAASVFNRFYKVQLTRLSRLFRRQALGANHHGFRRDCRGQ